MTKVGSEVWEGRGEENGGNFLRNNMVTICPVIAAFINCDF